MSELFIRSEMLFGKEGMNRLGSIHVAIFGIGGVGGACAEALARSGVGTLTLVDHDTVSLSNRNRQAVAWASTTGKKKTDVMEQLLSDINPDLCIRKIDAFFSAETLHLFDFSSYDYVVDCIDTVTAKLLLIEECKRAKKQIICSMGTGNKLDPSMLRIADIEKTKVCPLARVMRVQCKKRNLCHVPVVYSEELPIHIQCEKTVPGKYSTPGSTSFVPPAAGLLLASAVVRSVVLSKEISDL